MAENSLIDWTTHTWNPWRGCTKVAAECASCYIGRELRRYNKMENPFAGPERQKSVWNEPARWNRQAEAKGEPHKVFCLSVSDFFHDGADAWRDDAWDVIRNCPWLDWQILTKRPDLAADRFPDDWGRGWPHVWLGVTCGDPGSMWRVDELKRLKAKTKFISAEPLLQRVNFGARLRGIDWVITGCEKIGVGEGSPMDMDWVRDIDQQCQKYNVPHFLKQYFDKSRQSKIIHDGKLDGSVKRDFPRNLPTVPERGTLACERPGRAKPTRLSPTARRKIGLANH